MCHRLRRSFVAVLAAVLAAACAAADAPVDWPPRPVAQPSPGEIRPAPSPASPPASDEDPVGQDPFEPQTGPAAELLTHLPRATLVLAGPAERLELDAWIAADPGARQRGLMGVTDLADGSGMLFLFPAETDGGFWMKHTLIPLSIAFADPDGTVAAILDMEPCRAEPCPVYYPEVSYVAAVEVAQGWFAEAGVQTGWRLELPPDLPEAS